MKALILGGNGFIGKSLYNRFKKKIYQITKIDKKNLDLKSENKTLSFFKKNKNFDIILNCAADGGSVHYVTKYSADILYNNIKMSLSIYKALLKSDFKGTIYNLISNCVYPGQNGIQLEGKFEDGPVHKTIYASGNSKRALIHISQAFFNQYKIKSTNIMLPGVFGPGDSDNPYKIHALNGIIIRMIESHKKKEKFFKVWGTGKPIRDWLYIDDVVKAIYLVTKLKKNYLIPLNITEGKGYTIKKTAESIKTALKFDGSIIFDKNFIDGSPKKILKPKIFLDLFPNFKFHEHDQCIIKTVLYYKKLLK